MVPDPSTNLVGSDNGTAVQPLDELNVSEYGIDTWQFKTSTDLVASGISEDAYYMYEKGRPHSKVNNRSGILAFWTQGADAGSTIRVSFAKIGNPPKFPVFSRTSCDFHEDFELTITDTNEPVASIKYTTDGSEPGEANGIVYSTPIVIPAGKDITVKAVSINENGVSPVTTATFHYVPKYMLNVNVSNKNAISDVYYSTDSEYGYWYPEGSISVVEGEDIYIRYSLNTGYKCRGITLNGVLQDNTRNNFEFYMPASDVELVIETEFDPSSPADPQPADTTTLYNLTLVSNPLGAGYFYGDGKYAAAGTSVDISGYANSGYVFKGWTKDGDTISNKNSFRYTMPASDVVLMANYAYNPSSPGEPQQPALKHPLTVIASPAGAGTFSYTGSEVTYGEEYYVYAYPSTGYKFKGWIVNGAAQEETSSTLRGTMTEAGASVVGLFVFDPSSPDEPRLNVYDAITGRMIIDHFSPGGLSNTLRTLVNSSDYDNVTSLIVKGKTNSSDVSCIRSNLKMLQTLDLSRTAGVKQLSSYTFGDMALNSLILPADIESMSGSVFDGCSNLILLSLHSLVPPTVSSDTFIGFTPANCTLRVPEESVELYKADEYWGKFAEIIPLGNEIHVLEVQLPSAYRDGKLKNNTIEVINTATGRRQRYVITDRNIYTFNGAQKDDQYLVLMTSETGLVMSRIENVIMPDADYGVSFTDIKAMVPVSCTVTTPDGENCTDACTIEWFQSMSDGKENYLAGNSVLGNVPENEALIAKVQLPRDLAMKYLAPKPVKVTAQVGMEAVNIVLPPLKATMLSGRVIDEEGASVKNAFVKIYQRIAGKYDKSSVTKVNSEGRWTSAIVDAPLTVLTYSAAECVSCIDTIIPDMSQSGIDIGDVTMASSVGARIRVSLSYVEATLGNHTPDAANDYTDIENVTFSVYNRTKGRNHVISIQYPNILVLDKELDADDELVVKVSAVNNAFHDQEVVVTADADARLYANFKLIGKGGIRAEYGRTDNPQTIALLVNSKGDVIKQAQFENSAVNFIGLDSGNYSVVAMTRSGLLNAVASLSAMNELGLVVDKDYVLADANVEDGVITAVKFEEVPSVDESLFTFTGSNTSITPNKNSVSSGQYVTIRSLIDFKPVYRNRVNNVRIEYTLPEGCSFVEGSVMKGPNKFGYDCVGNNVVIDFGSDYSDQLRFCLIPTHSGLLSVVARAIFDIDGQTVIQPIGNANISVKDIDFVLPPRSCYNEIVATGMAPANSNVRIIQDGTVVGEGLAGQNGAWTVECSLIDTYNQKDCQMQAVVTTPEKVELFSTVRTVVFDGAAIMIDRVTMLTGNEEVVFDFNHKNNTISYTWVDDKLFTFIVKLSEECPDNIEGVRLFVKTLDGGERGFDCYYSESRDAWLCVGNFTADTAPTNVAVSLYRSGGLIFDRIHFTSFITDEQEKTAKAREVKQIIESLRQEAADIKVQTDVEIAVLDKFLDAYDQLSNEERHTTVNELLAQNGINAATFDYSDDLIGDKDEIKRIIETSRTLLLPVDEYDYSSVDSLLAAFERFEAECGIEDDTEIVASADVITGEYDGQEYTFKSVTADQIDLSQYDENQIWNLKADDGSQVKIISTEAEVVVLDETQNHAWITTLKGSGTQMEPFRARSGINWDEIRELGERIKEFYDYIKSNIDAVCAKAEHMIEMAERDIINAENEIERITRRINDCGDKLRDTEIELKKIEKQLKSSYVFVDERKKLEDLYELYKDQEKALSKQIKEAKDKLGKANVTRATLKTKGRVFKEVVDKATVVLDVVWRIGKAIYWGQEAKTVHNQWLDFIDTILPCEADNYNAMRLSGDASMAEVEVAQGYLAAMRCAAGSGVAGIISTGVGYLSNFVGNPIAGIAIKGLSIIGDVASGMLYDKAKSICEDTRSKSKSYFARYVKERRQLKCRKKMEDDQFDDPNYTIPKGGNNGGGGNGGDGKIPAGNDAAKKVVIDPAGYVYEGVHSNRVEGVKATAYYRQQVEDMFGDINLEVRKWDAEEYAQKNPLFTDANGMYAWDVPPGEWQVKFEKDGYQTAYSEWLPVPPPQLEVNVGIVQNKQPEVVEARAYEEGVEVQFDKFMDLTTLTTDNIFVTANGEKLNGEICFVDAALADEYASEDDADALRYASRVRFVPETSLGVTTGEIRVTVSRNVLSYAGIPMTETFSQVLDVEKEVQIIYADDVKVLYGGEKTVTVYAVPFDAAAGRTLRIANSSDLISSIDVDEAVLDEEGKAEIKVKGELPGSSQLTFSIDDVTATGTCAVDVVTEIITAEAPKASRASGTAVYRGTKLVLTTDSKDATIYFTTDGSCPCDENGTRRKYTVPIIIDDDTKILAMTAVGSGDEDVSETVEFNYTLKRSDMDIQMEEGWTWVSHNLEGAIPSSELASDEGVQRILSQTEELFRDPQLGMVGSLKELAASESYKIETTNATERKRFSDIARNPAAPINLSAGWNWLGYPVSQTMSVDEAFATTAAEALDVVVGQNGFAQYDGEKWIGTLETMSPGMGYMYQSQSAKKVVYNTSIVSNAAAKYATGISRNLPLVLDIHKYGKIMPVITTINDSDGNVLDSEDYQVAAFCGSECRGIGRVVNGLVMMNVYGNANDNIVFHVYDAEGENSFSNNTSMVFVETVVGSVFKPFAIRINNATGISDVSYSGRIKVSVKGNMLRIKGIDTDDIELVEVYGVNGQRLLRETNVSEYGIDISTLTGGVYVVIVNGNGEYTYHKIAIR